MVFLDLATDYRAAAVVFAGFEFARHADAEGISALPRLGTDGGAGKNCVAA